ncbi:MAG: radical SAM protein [Gammaproteobacteria bacterium]
MSAVPEIIAIESDKPVYDHHKSKWYGKVKSERLSLVLSFYAVDCNEISMPLASISAYLKREFPWVDVTLMPILLMRDAEKYSPENFARNIQALNPDLIAFSIMSPHWYPIRSYFEKVKEVMPDLPLVVGGYQPMLSPEETISNKDVDIICVGDGEYAMGHLVQFLKGTKPGPMLGMWEKLDNGEIFKDEPVQTADLTALPFPDYDIFSVDGDFRQVVTSMMGPQEILVFPVMTGRGCPYRCTYCCNTPLLEGWKTKKTFLRKYDPEALVKELVRLRDTHGVEYFEFWDELFLSNLRFVRAFFDLYKEHVKLPFAINSRVEVMNEEFCQRAAEVGCDTIWFGIESGDEKYRREMLGRKMTNEQIITAAENCKNAGIARLTLNMTGMPLETADNMRQTLALNKLIKPEIFTFFTYIPLRGTPLYDIAEREGLLLPNTKDLQYTTDPGNDPNHRFVFNLKEQKHLLTADEYHEICREMSEFKRSNNTYSYLAMAEQTKRNVAMTRA